MELWGGIECTINRVADRYLDQLELSGHYRRPEDLDLFAGLGIKRLRYPLLWEKHQPERDSAIDWSFAASRLERLRELNIAPIAGLVHHGSGPVWANIADEAFVEGLEAYAAEVAARFPWIRYYTPVNEPLTTARFCGLYGVWHPHGTDDKSFIRILLNECKATLRAMMAIRKINPNAQLVQTEDIGKAHSTPLLSYQAEFENHRRWLALDLLCGRVDSQHPLWDYLLKSGASAEELEFFRANPCPPDIIGVNHYLTSERYLDEHLEQFPVHTHGGNGKHRYADVEVVRMGNTAPDGPYALLKEVWDRYELPIAVTEVHLHCTREEQLRWVKTVYEGAGRLAAENAAVLAVTPWALLGSFGWDCLLTQENCTYEPGVFDVSSGRPRPTALARLVKSYAAGEPYHSPLIDAEGWWQRDIRVLYYRDSLPAIHTASSRRGNPPLLILGKTGTLGQAFARACEIRNIEYVLTGREHVDIGDMTQAREFIKEVKPWGIVNAAGYVRVDDAESDCELCYRANTDGPANLASLSAQYGIKLLTFSSDLVFDGSKHRPYLEEDPTSPLNVYGLSKAYAEQKVQALDPGALIIRTSAFFSPWDDYNFVINTLRALKRGERVVLDRDMYVSPTYVPDLTSVSLDLMLDDERGIWHLSNDGSLSWAMLAEEVARRAKADMTLLQPVSHTDMGYRAKRPLYSSLQSSHGRLLPSLDHALNRFFDELGPATRLIA